MRDPFLKCRRPEEATCCLSSPSTVPLLLLFVLQQQSKAGCVGLGQERGTEQQELWGQTQGNPDFIRSLSMLRLWKLFLLTWWLFHCVWKNAQDSWRVFQSLISLSTPPAPNPPSQYCFTREVSANVYNKNLLTLLHPMILLLFSCCDKGSKLQVTF